MIWKIAFRNIFRSRMRSLVTLSAVAFGCAALILAAGFIEKSLAEMQEGYIRAVIGHMRIARHGYFENALAEPYAHMISDAPSVMQKIHSIQGVRYVSARLNMTGLLSNGDSTLTFMAQATVPEDDDRNGMLIEYPEGERITGQDTHSVEIGYGLAAALKIHPKQSVTLLVSPPRGGINALDLTVKGIFRSISKEYDDHALRLVLATGQKLLRTRDVQSITIFLANTADTDRVRDQLIPLFQKEHLDLDVKTWYELPEADFVVKMRPFYSKLFNFLRLIILSMVLLSIMNTMNMSVLERVGEIGTIAAMGTRRRDIVTLFLTEGLLLGLIGAVIGVIGGIALGHLIDWIGIPMPTAPGTTMQWIAGIKIVPSACVSASLCAIVTTVLSAFFPALKAARLEIAEALRHNV